MKNRPKPAKLVVHRSAFERVIVTDDHTNDQNDDCYLDSKSRVALEQGKFSFVGVRARITLKIPNHPEGHSILHEVESPGLWGVQTNSDEAYFDEVFTDECDTLEHMLTTLGVEVQP